MKFKYTYLRSRPENEFQKHRSIKTQGKNSKSSNISTCKHLKINRVSSFWIKNEKYHHHACSYRKHRLPSQLSTNEFNLAQSMQRHKIWKQNFWPRDILLITFKLAIACPFSPLHHIIGHVCSLLKKLEQMPASFSPFRIHETWSSPNTKT